MLAKRMSRSLAVDEGGASTSGHANDGSGSWDGGYRMLSDPHAQEKSLHVTLA
jgi:hypothetical protein